MKTVKGLIIILLTTATATAATDPRLGLWTYGGALDPHTLDVIYEFEEPLEDARYGTTFDEGYLWHRTDERDVVNYYYKIDLYGNIVSSFPGPGILSHYCLETCGIDNDADGNLWITYNDYVYHVTPTGTIIPPKPFPVLYPNDISWDGEYLWGINCPIEGASIYKYDVNTGTLLDEFWIPGGSGTWRASIAADEEYLYAMWGNNGYEWEPYGYYYILTHTGETVYFKEAFWVHGWDIAEWPILSVQPMSLGQIKAMFR